MAQRVDLESGQIMLIMSPPEAGALMALMNNADRLVGDVIRFDAPHLAKYNDEPDGLNQWRFVHTLRGQVSTNLRAVEWAMNTR